MNKILSNIKSFMDNFTTDLKRALKTNELSGNEALVKKNLNTINEVTSDKYLENKRTAKAKAELKNVQKHMISHYDDYVAYFRNEYLNETIEYTDRYLPKKMVREDYIRDIVLKKKYTKTKWIIAILSLILVEGFSALLGSAALPVGIIIALVNANGIPYFNELYHKPYQKGKYKYLKILDNIKDKINTTIEEETIERGNPYKQVAELSAKIAACLDLINKEPYPNCIKEQQALMLLNARFLQEELASKTTPTSQMKPKLVLVSYETRLEEIRRIILENQRINRSRKIVEEKVINSDLNREEKQPEVKENHVLKRYRIKKD